jgi:hypothetical protein
MVIPIPILREIMLLAISKLPFDEDFYLSSYSDIRTAYSSGRISDLRAHFVDTGYFEGRLGVNPNIDERFYRETYPDVAAAIAKGDVTSCLDHYVLMGAAEGRCANRGELEVMNHWAEVFALK